MLSQVSGAFPNIGKTHFNEISRPLGTSKCVVVHYLSTSISYFKAFNLCSWNVVVNIQELMDKKSVEENVYHVDVYLDFNPL
jgi:hypothetical protein